MTAAQLLQRIQSVDISGLVRAEIITFSDGEMVQVKLQRLRGAIRDDASMQLTMLIDPSDQHGDLFFVAPNLEECDPFDKALTIYMDANDKVRYGKHWWNPKSKNVSFAFALPLPAGIEDFPDTSLLQRMLTDMYEGLLWPEVKTLEFKIADNDLSNPEEKQQQLSKVAEHYMRLTSARHAAADEAV